MSNLRVHIYTDGGADIKRNLAGWGYHGYIYTLDVAKVGMGSTKYIGTATGYKSKKDSDKLEQVTISNFIDGWGYDKSQTTNNQVELSGAIGALLMLHEFDNETPLEHVTVHADSKYVIKGITEFISKWKKKGWLLSNGEPVKNQELWMELDRVNSLFEGRIDWVHVKGHSEDLGNDTADMLATLAKNMNLRSIEDTDSYYEVKDGKGYFKAEASHSRLLSQSYWYFNEGLPLDKDDYGHWYYTGTHAPKDNIEDLGQAINNASYSVICLKEPNAEVDMVTEFQNSYFSHEKQRSLPVIGLMANVLSGRTSKNLRDFGARYLKHNKPTGNVYGIDDTDYTYHYSEPRLARRAFDALNELTARLRRYKEGTLWVNEKTYDLKELICDESDKKPKLLPTIPSSGGQLKITIESLKGVKKDVKLTLGLDLPNRNSLNRLIHENLRIHLVTWEIDGAIKYATTVDSDEGFGIWCNYYSCLLLT